VQAADTAGIGPRDERYTHRIGSSLGPIQAVPPLRGDPPNDDSLPQHS